MEPVAKHDCHGTLPSRDYGDAITSCWENEQGQLWVGNYEYGSQVAYCPYCGFKARVAPVVKERD